MKNTSSMSLPLVALVTFVILFNLLLIGLVGLFFLKLIGLVS